MKQNHSTMEWFLMALNKYADFSGRSRRKEYWMFTLFNYIIIAVPYFLMLSGAGTLALIGSGLVAVISLGLVIPSLAVLVRRLHDTNRSGWWFLIAFIPLIGTIVLIVFLCQDSQTGANKWGPNPKGLGGDGQDLTGVLDSDY